MLHTVRLLTPRVLWVLESTATALSLLLVLSTIASTVFPSTSRVLLGQRITVQDLVVGGFVFAVWALLVRMTNLYRADPIGLVSEIYRVAIAVGGATIALFALGRVRPGSTPGAIALEFCLCCFAGIVTLRVAHATPADSSSFNFASPGACKIAM